MFVDVPIGLPDRGRPDQRKCDQEARWRLNRNRSGQLVPLGERRGRSVFAAPARETLKAASYGDACRINFSAVGKQVPQQAFHILPLIRDADALLRQDEKARKVIREVHPELCFWGFNGERPMQHRKKTAGGQDERLAILERNWPRARAAAAEACARYPRKEVAKDDIFDAMAAAATAKARVLQCLPKEPPYDSAGLPMQMIWAAGKP